MTVQEVVNKIMGEIPRMSQPKATDVVKEAWHEIVGEKGWTWTTKLGTVDIPGTISTGSVAVTKASATVTFDATAITNLNAGDDLVPIVGRQIRFESQSMLYTLTAYNDTTGVATLDRVYVGATNASVSTWSVFKSYYTPPGGEDFVRWNSIIDTDNGYLVDFGFTKAQIDRLDPQRQSESNPYKVALVDRNDPTLPGVSRFEFWPLPGTEISLQVQYHSRGLVDANNVTFPALTYEFPKDLQPRLISTKALQIAYKWAEAHKGDFEELRGVNWRFLWQQAEADYNKLLVESKKLDDEIDITGFFEMYRGLGYPVDSKFAQSHDVGWIY